VSQAPDVYGPGPQNFTMSCVNCGASEAALKRMPPSEDSTSPIPTKSKQCQQQCPKQSPETTPPPCAGRQHQPWHGQLLWLSSFVLRPIPHTDGCSRTVSVSYHNSGCSASTSVHRTFTSRVPSSHQHFEVPSFVTLTTIGTCLDRRCLRRS